jgi:putative phage-type endonuclease
VAADEPVVTAIATPVRQNSPEWLAMRRTGIGSSDAPVIAGERGSVLELWAEKSGLVEREEPDETSARLFEWGHRLEPIVADWYTETTGRALRRVNRMLVHPDIPWAFASLDRVTVGSRRIVEIKTTRRGWDSAEPVPGHVQVQVQHQLWVTDYEVADVAVLTGGSEPKVYEIPRDDAFIANLAYLETEFWGWVTSGTRPPMDGSENARRTLSRLHPRNDGVLIAPTPELDRVFFDWMAARVVKDQAEGEADTLANTLRALIGDADGIEGRVTWRKAKDSVRVDWPTVAHEVGLSDPEGLAAAIAAHTTTAEGPRVLRPVWKGDQQ